ncbi:hypothetical protein PIB30_022803 [Stylosanthes scabra]|uniref:Uncharacterized protein n=1 Tax=Stylosanthes scabra TaxID=79078 RepID=A0ABU6U979_9FABA|nr:hypothetical protein [Stylosanthes scabra]
MALSVRRYHKSVVGRIGLHAVASGTEAGPHPESAAMVGNSTASAATENNGVAGVPRTVGNVVAFGADVVCNNVCLAGVATDDIELKGQTCQLRITHVPNPYTVRTRAQYRGYLLPRCS